MALPLHSPPHAPAPRQRPYLPESPAGRPALATGAATVDISVVVPVRNAATLIGGSARTLCDFLDGQPASWELILVDDHSDAPTAHALRALCTEEARVTVLRNDAHRGKGYAVAAGLAAATGRYRVFTDVDLAYPASEIGKIVAALDRGADVAIACRVLPESTYTMSPSFFSYLYTRHLMSRLFNRVAQGLLLPGVLDTQAGLKGFTAAAAERIVPRLTIPGFGFDLELLYIARTLGLAVDQVAVSFRYDSEPSTVRFVRDSVQMLADVARVRWNGWRGAYR